MGYHDTAGGGGGVDRSRHDPYQSSDILQLTKLTNRRQTIKTLKYDILNSIRKVDKSR